MSISMNSLLNIYRTSRNVADILARETQENISWIVEAFDEKSRWIPDQAEREAYNIFFEKVTEWYNHQWEYSQSKHDCDPLEYNKFTNLFLKIFDDVINPLPAHFIKELVSFVKGMCLFDKCYTIRWYKDRWEPDDRGVYRVVRVEQSVKNMDDHGVYPTIHPIEKNCSSKICIQDLNLALDKAEANLNASLSGVLSKEKLKAYTY